MKKLLFIPILLLLTVACSPESEELKTPVANDIENFELVVASLENNLSASSQNSVVYDRHEVLEIENSPYLRSYSGDLVTTTLLKKTPKGYQTRGISCTTSGCSGNNGCIPESNGKSCSACFLGDCTKTVTSETNKK